jgi:hypothetical protein
MAALPVDPLFDLLPSTSRPGTTMIKVTLMHLKMHYTHNDQFREPRRTPKSTIANHLY